MISPRQVRCVCTDPRLPCKRCAATGHECFVLIPTWRKPPQSHLPSSQEHPQIDSSMFRVMSEVPTQPVKEHVLELRKPAEKAPTTWVDSSQVDFGNSIPIASTSPSAHYENVTSSCFEWRCELVPDYQLGVMRSYDSSCFDLKIYSVRPMIINIHV